MRLVVSDGLFIKLPPVATYSNNYLYFLIPLKVAHDIIPIVLLKRRETRADRTGINAISSQRRLPGTKVLTKYLIQRTNPSSHLL